MFNTMTKTASLSAIALSLMTFMTTAQADHNSPWGEGWAQMPNDIHNTRIDTRDDDSDAFIEFVRYGAGSTTVNRFLDEDSSVASIDSGMGGGMGGSMGQGGKQAGRNR